MVDTNTVIEGNVKFRDGRKWKSRWGVMRKLSPVADCLHLQLYRDSKDRYKQGQTKASLSLQHFLGVQSGFTLDKESNTIAIICQDVTVVLAFDTRERLIQWQVKIANNLGEDEQFLVQVSSGPQRAKLAPGPALLHVLEHQFCLTVGVPPRLVGCWQINQLRRYGVVESRFCFEGGSRCGKGEGLYVLVTDQGEEITRTFRLAAEGKLSSKKRPASRNASDSPKKSSHGRSETRLSDMSGLETSHSSGLPLTGEFPAAEESCRGCTCGHEELGWPAADLAADFADASSVADFMDSHNREGLWSGEGMERCASCISKLGALSRSSTAAITPNTSFTPAWTMEANTPVTKHEQTRSEKSNASCTGNSQGYMEDESSGKRPGSDCWSSKQNQNASGMERCACCPPARPPKPGHLSSQPHKSLVNSPQPQKSSANSSPKKKQNVPTGSNSCACNLTVNPYDNYDIPKMPQGYPCSKDQNCHWFQNPLAGEPEFYDTPKTIKENIATEFGNYDTPPPMLVERKQMCTSLQKNQFLTRVMIDNEDMQMVACPCQRMMCWAENWMFFPYCRRGSGRENTAPPPLHKRVTQCGGQVLLNNLSSVYATVDKSKKIRNRQACEDQSSLDKLLLTRSEPHQHCKESPNKSNYDDKISNEKSDQDTGVNVNISETGQNYMNFDFVKSLEFYENSKDMMQKSSQTRKENDKIDNEVKSVGTNTTPQTPDNPGVHTKICTKCRHECKGPAPNPGGKQDDYLMMEPSASEHSIRTSDQQPVNSCGRHVPGYLPMHPIGGPSPMNSQDIFKLKWQQQQMMSGNERAASSPSLLDHNADRSRRRSDIEMHRIPSSAIFGFNQSISAANSPYLRRRVLGCLHESESEINSVSRKRSCSADSANHLKELQIPTHKSVVSCTSSGVDEQYKSHSENIHSHKINSKKSVDFNMETFTLNESDRNSEKRNDEALVPSMQVEPLRSKDVGQYENIQSIKSNHNEPLVHVRRSSSAPSKSNHNRDSSSSNDSGVSSCSLKKQNDDFTESDLKPGSSGMSRRYTYTTNDKDLLCKCFHSSLPRRSKSVDPLRDLAFQFQKVEVPMKSSSAEAEVPIFHAKRESRGCLSPGAAVPYMDSRSTSSGTSDMSDYFETLSLSSYSSSDTPDSLHFGHQAVCTMRPRSGKEYQKIDTILDTELKKIQNSKPSGDSGESSIEQKEERL